jgi:hypothetical protein
MQKTESKPDARKPEPEAAFLPSAKSSRLHGLP